MMERQEGPVAMVLYAIQQKLRWILLLNLLTEWYYPNLSPTPFSMPSSFCVITCLNAYACQFNDYLTNCSFFFLLALQELEGRAIRISLAQGRRS